MKTRFLGVAAALALFGIVFPIAPASAVVIFSDNFDATTITENGGVYSVGNFPGWVGGLATGSGGVALWGLFNPGSYPPAGYSAPSPNNVAYTGNGDGSREFIRHVFGPVVPGTTYSLSVDVGDRLDYPFVFHNGPNGPTGYRISLAICTGPGVCFLPFVDELNPAALTAGAFTSVSVSGTAPLFENGNLVIFLSSGGYPGDINQINWDNVVLSAVPEPSTWAMMLIGFAGIGFVAYRRTKKRAVAIAAA